MAAPASGYIAHPRLKDQKVQILPVKLVYVAEVFEDRA